MVGEKDLRKKYGHMPQLNIMLEGKVGKVIERHVSVNGMISAQSEVPCIIRGARHDLRIRNQKRRAKRRDSRLLPLPKVKDTVPRTVVPSCLPDSYCRGTLDHSPARATFSKDEIRREHANNGPKTIIKRIPRLFLTFHHCYHSLSPSHLPGISNTPHRTQQTSEDTVTDGRVNDRHRRWVPAQNQPYSQDRNRRRSRSSSLGIRHVYLLRVDGDVAPE
ncbi:hypothetical protein WN944_012902 [Citrus x changshan-huyou]|uniref:Uncharacterized protein n=1 Tax=Citrus x changshan-huyou TaxID=2935761 RepID=A0AAP0QJZ6_9ROSI